MNTLQPFPVLGDASSADPTHEQIAARAQEIWLELGRPTGRDLAIWLEAEAELQATCHRVYRHPHLTLDECK